MAKYKFNPEDFTYQRIDKGFKAKMFNALKHMATGVIIASITLFISFSIFKSPKHKQLQVEYGKLKNEFKRLEDKIKLSSAVLSDIENRDDFVYRTIFETAPIASTKRNGGLGGVNRYKNLQALEEADLLINVEKRLDSLMNRLYVQSKSFDEIKSLVDDKKLMLSSIPAIQPVANKNLKRMASGYGYRMHPILKVRAMHKGMDFSAPKGTEIYATGDGIVERVQKVYGGYGRNIIINHGYGYKTLYAHMNSFNVRRGQRVKRGEVIGYVGNTGSSTAPHLHYEVKKDGKHVNPAHYYYIDISPEDYELLLERASNYNQSLD